MKIVFTKKGFIEAIIGIIFLCIGMWILLWTYSALNNVDFAGNVWNRRIYTFIAIGFFSAGFAMTWNGYRKLMWFCLTFIFLTITLLLLGGIIAFDAATNPDPNNFWVAFDTGWTDIGLGIKLIGDAVKNIVPIALLCLIIYQVLYSGEGDENLKALLEGAVCLGFIIAFNLFGNISF
ncbi:MAG: hypothetical protein ACP6IY_18160 [Promethearchaeia archaeon]